MEEWWQIHRKRNTSESNEWVSEWTTVRRSIVRKRVGKAHKHTLILRDFIYINMYQSDEPLRHEAKDEFFCDGCNNNKNNYIFTFKLFMHPRGFWLHFSFIIRSFTWDRFMSIGNCIIDSPSNSTTFQFVLSVQCNSVLCEQTQQNKCSNHHQADICASTVDDKNSRLRKNFSPFSDKLMPTGYIIHLLGPEKW